MSEPIIPRCALVTGGGRGIGRAEARVNGEAAVQAELTFVIQ